MTKKKKNYQSFRIKNINDISIQTIQLSEETQEALGINKNEKVASDYLKEYTGVKIFEELESIFYDTLEKSKSDSFRKQCKYCTSKEIKLNESDKLCTKYHYEIQLNRFMAEREFIGIVERNKHLFKDKKQLTRLTIAFYECYLFQDYRLYFNVDKLSIITLKEGLYSISDILEKSEYFQRMKLINEARHDLEMRNLNYKIDTGKENEKLSIQLDFFKSKEKYYEKKKKIDDVNDGEQDKENDLNENSYYPFHSVQEQNLFNRMLDDDNTPTGIIYTYRKMYNDNYMSLEPTPFKNWFVDAYPDIPDFKMKTLNEIGNKKKRNTIYQNLKRETGVK